MPLDLPPATARRLLRADACRLLAACYYQPMAAFAEEDLFGSLAAVASRLDPELAECARRLGSAFAATDLEELLVDYARLFLGPPSPLAKPYASVWAAAAAPGVDPTAAILSLYADAGFEVDAEFRDLPDHVAAELELLYLLNHRAAAAEHAGDASALGISEALARRLVSEHLVRWVPPFAQALRAGAQSTFYRELGQLTERLVLLESRRAA